jgi:D-alanyl-D-alanine carboxypeptidase
MRRSGQGRLPRPASNTSPPPPAADNALLGGVRASRAHDGERPAAEGRPRRRRSVLALALAALLMMAAAAPAAGSQAPSGELPRGELQQLLEELVATGQPGAIGLARHGEETWRGASGLATLDPARPMRPGLRYKIGSITKTFTATVVLQLVGEHKLRLGDSVERWLPGLVPNGHHITIRQLLQHTSGLFTYDEDPRIAEPYLQGDLDFVWRPRQLVAIATEHPPLFAPGTGWSYSNTGYVLLGLIIRAATHSSVQQQLQTRILRPLGLRHTSFPVTNPHIVGPHAHGYQLGAGPGGTPLDFTGLSPSWAWATGNMVSTVEDVARFYRALLGGRLLPPGLLRAMQTTVDTGSGLQYGLGLASIELPCGGGTVWGHEGGLPGYENWALATRDGENQVVMMVNAGDGSNTYVELVLDPVFKALCAIQSTSS